MLIFFAIVLALGVWSANDTGPHHPNYVEDRSWYEKELYASKETWKRNNE